MRLLQKALTFDDVLLVPAYSDILPKDTSLKTRLTRNISLSIPLVSAAMDTVTEARLAIAMAQEGGIGIIHKNMTAAQQAAEVRLVKKFEAGVIRSPISVGPSTSIREVLQLTRAHNISGVPVVDGEKLVGIVTSRDLRFERKLEDPVRNIMTRQDKLVTVREGARSLDRALDDMAQVFRMGAWTRMRHVVLPQLAPYLAAAARSGLSLVWKIVLIVELLGRPNGVGFEIGVAFQLFDVTRILAYALAFVAVMLAIETFLVQPLERHVSRWRPKPA